MSESDGNIEYLDEDAETVLQCLQNSTSFTSPLPRPIQQVERQLLIERKKRTRDENDSDYDPEDTKLHIQKKPRASALHIPPARTILDKSVTELYNRKKMKIRIPDYDDPLCLPVRAFRSQESDTKRLDNWNNVCLEHFKYCDEVLKPERGATKKSVRNAVFKNVVSKHTGIVETTIWSKTSVEGTDGNKKSEILQCILPRYKEKRIINNFILGNRKGKSSGRSIFETVLTKEVHKDGEALVVYKPKESMSAVYELVDKRKTNEGSTELGREAKMYLKEVACCKVCVACYQGSHRGVSELHKKKSLVCPICGGAFVSMYNLLSHFKGHAAGDVRRHKKLIGAILAQVVGYHYKCRVCRQQFASIKGLRKHVPLHGGPETFKCELGNHIVRNIRK